MADPTCIEPDSKGVACGLSPQHILHDEHPKDGDAESCLVCWGGKTGHHPYRPGVQCETCGGVRWIPSELPSADGATRCPACNGSKCVEVGNE